MLTSFLGWLVGWLLSIFLSYLFFFCRDRENSGYIDKYNLNTERVEATISVGGYTARKYYYQWNGYTGMDLAVDEQGLWVLWGGTGNSGKLYAHKIDVYKNVVTHGWALNTGKHKMSAIKNTVVE